MNLTYYDGISLLCILGIILGIRLMNSPKTAKYGNLLGAISLACAVIVTLVKNDIIDNTLLWIAIAIGGIAGYYLAARVTMLKMPQMVALLNGLGGGASALVAVVILLGDQGAFGLSFALFTVITSVLALIVGGITFSGSMIATAKLEQRISQRPVYLKRHSFILGLISITLLVLFAVILHTYFVSFGNRSLGDTLGNNTDVLTLILVILIAAFSLLWGIIFTMRVGGADMPITISLLNSMSGLAGAITGFAIYDPLLIAVGGIVGAAGLILTRVMCKGMNRSLLQVLTGKTVLGSGTEAKTAMSGENKELFAESSEKQIEEDDYNKKIKKITAIIAEAENIIIVPGYGMALAQAQYQVKVLYDKLMERGKDVKFAIHPVAGRMPGHMNVLLAEVDIPYEILYELDVINGDFCNTDLVIVIGANDVINPAANTAQGTPIYGMPILNVDRAKHIVVLNKDTKPGYSGVPNTIYKMDKVILILGDAKETIAPIISYV